MCRAHQVVDSANGCLSGAVEHTDRIDLEIGDDGPDPWISGFFSSKKRERFVAVGDDGILLRVGDNAAGTVEKKKHAIVRHLLSLQ